MAEDTLRLAPRRRDPRRGLSEVVATVVRTVRTRADAGAARSAFEEAVCRLLLAKSVSLRDARAGGALDRRPDRAMAAVEVPAQTPSTRIVLEATGDLMVFIIGVAIPISVIATFADSAKISCTLPLSHLLPSLTKISSAATSTPRAA